MHYEWIATSDRTLCCVYFQPLSVLFLSLVHNELMVLERIQFAADCNLTSFASDWNDPCDKVELLP